MTTVSLGELGTFDCYRVDEVNAAREAAQAGKKVMLARTCSHPDCDDLLLGESLDPDLQVACEDGHHNTRPGFCV